MAEGEEGKEGESAQDGAAATPAKKKGKGVLLAVIGVVVLIVAAGVPLFIFMRAPAKPSETELAAVDAAGGQEGAVLEGSAAEDELSEGEEALGAFLPLDTFVVNLSGGGFIRCQIQLEFVERDIPRRIYVKMVPLRDALIALLANRSGEDLTTAKGKETLKADIRELVNDLLRKEDVKQVYFTQFIVQ